MQSLRSPVNGGAIKKRKFGADLNNKRTKAYRLYAEEVQIALKKWEKHLNSINTDPAPIFVENNVDFEGPPQVTCLLLLDQTFVLKSVNTFLFSSVLFSSFLWLLSVAGLNRRLFTVSENFLSCEYYPCCS